MDHALPDDFAIPASLAQGVVPWRSWACDLILAEDSYRTKLISRLTPSEHATLDLEVFHITCEARTLNVAARALGNVEKACGDHGSGTRRALGEIIAQHAGHQKCRSALGQEKMLNESRPRLGPGFCIFGKNGCEPDRPLT
jgi:hypothetical protein